jgi:Trypsin
VRWRWPWRRPPPRPSPARARSPIAGAPYVAWLREGCTGTLIAPDRILTAGHCLSEFTPVGFSVIVGRDGNALVPFGRDRFQGAIAHGGIPALGFSVNPGFKESFPFAHKSSQNAGESRCESGRSHARMANM